MIPLLQEYPMGIDDEWIDSVATFVSIPLRLQIETRVVPDKIIRKYLVLFLSLKVL